MRSWTERKEAQDQDKQKCGTWFPMDTKGGQKNKRKDLHSVEAVLLETSARGDKVGRELANKRHMDERIRFGHGSACRGPLCSSTCKKILSSVKKRRTTGVGES